MSSTDTGSVMDPHGRKRGKSVSAAAKGEEEERGGDHAIVSKAPPPSSTVIRSAGKDGDVGKAGDGDKQDADILTDQMRECCIRYYEFHRCTAEEKDGDKSKCGKFAEAYLGICQSDWVQKWDDERKRGLFPQPI